MWCKVGKHDCIEVKEILDDQGFFPLHTFWRGIGGSLFVYAYQALVDSIQYREMIVFS